MTPQTIKLLMMFFFATALLNITNYLFYCLYSQPSHQGIMAGPKHIMFTTKPHSIYSARWTAILLNKDDQSPKTPSPVSKVKYSSSNEDYRDQSTDVSHYYYFDGERRGLILCPEKPPQLGPVKVDETVTLDAIEQLYAKLEFGGIYEESQCSPRQSLAVIIPYSGQKTQLLKFLYILHPILIKQQLKYQVFVVQANQSLPINRGKLLNAGFTEAQRMRQNGGWRCVIFHEHYLVPTDSRNLYRCSKSNPQQLVTYVDQRPYEYSFGGAIAIDTSHFSKVNGFSNLYITGNDAVYDDLYTRLENSNLTIIKSTFGKYSQLSHSIDFNLTRFQTIQTSSPLNLIDGLSTLTYSVKNIGQKQMYTLIEVDISVPYQGNSTEKTWNRLLSQASVSNTTKITQGLKKKNNGRVIN